MVKLSDLYTYTKPSLLNKSHKSEKKKHKTPKQQPKSIVAEIATAWLDTLLDVIDLLPKDIIKKEVSWVSKLFLDFTFS